MDKISIITWLGLPESFISILLSLGLILTLSPYLAGTDFGIFKVPDLNAQYRKFLKWLGPVFLLGLSLLFVPLLKPYNPGPYKPHEHPFYSDKSIQQMEQSCGNTFCRAKFDQLKDTGDIGGLDPNQVKHVWANITKGDCVANTEELGTRR